MTKKFSSILCLCFLLVACGLTTPEVSPALVATSLPSPTSTLMPTTAPSPTDKSAVWTLVWQDEFDGTQLDLENWTFDVGGHGWGNQEAQAYTDRPENVRMEDGMLVIEARREESPIAGRTYSSARIKTDGLHTWQYAKIEARMKLPYGQGIWPAFWMLGDNFSTHSWPACGEVDIMEFIGKEPDQIHATLHGPGYSGSNGTGSNLIVSAASLKNDFHVYAIEWEENEIRWYFDRQQYFQLTAEDVLGEWAFDHPFFVILNLAVGGGWPGYPDESTVFPQFLYVDYVRVYQKP